MDFKAIEEMIKTMDNSKLGYLEVDWHGISIVMRKQGEPDFSRKSEEVSTAQVEEEKDIIVETKKDTIVKEKANEEIKKEEELKKIEENLNIKEVVSPIVGTFYKSAGPDKAAFVEVGTKVKKGDTLCIIEAMKLMNEIQSDVDGEVVEILVENNQMVEYGQPMFKISLK